MKEIKIIATNGGKNICFAWLSINDDIYSALISITTQLHHSYHKDGSIHWKRENVPKDYAKNKFLNEKGYSKQEKREPPKQLKGTFTFLEGGLRLDNCFIKNYPNYNEKKTDKIIFMDIRSIKSKQKFVSLYIDLVEKNSYENLINCFKKKNGISVKKKFIADIHCFFEFNPWVVISLLYKN